MEIEPSFHLIYFRDISYSLDSCHSLGSFVAGGVRFYLRRYFVFHFVVAFLVTVSVVLFVVRVLLATLLVRMSPPWDWLALGSFSLQIRHCRAWTCVTC